MKYLKFVLTVIIFVGLSLSGVNAGTFKADAKTKRIPEGTIFKLEFLNNISTSSGSTGDAFSAMLKNEQAGETGIILPLGSVVRGSIYDVKTSKRFSRGAKLYLDFDHIVTPTGRQIPLDMAICSYDRIYYDGGLYKNLGYGEALKENYQKAVEITKRSTNYGLSVKDDHPGLQFITTPFCAVGGFIGGAGYLIGDSVADMFKKGKDVQINAGEVIEVKLLTPIDIPVY